MSFKYLVALVCVTCGGDVGSGGNNDSKPDSNVHDAPPGAVLELTALSQRMAEASCPKLQECCAMSELEAFGIGNAGSCVADFKAIYDETHMQYFLRSISDGYVLYDGQKAEQCIQQIAAMTCQELSQNVEILYSLAFCESPFTPNSSQGGACGRDTDCPSHWCQDDTCEAPAMVGSSCTDSTCGADPDLYCVSNSCASRLEVGATCNNSNECKSGLCSQSVCALLCDGASG